LTFLLKDYLKNEEQKEVEKREEEAYDNEYWFYNPNEDAGDRV